MKDDIVFDTIERIVIGLEGKGSNDPRDEGGETVYGLSRAAHPSMPWPPTLDDAKAEYRKDYYDAHRCAEMPFPWALAVFDAAVNQTEMAVRMAQRALNTTQDGVIGAETLKLMAMSGSDDALLSFLAFRADAYMHRPDYDVWGHGWLRRLVRIAQCGEHQPTP